MSFFSSSPDWFEMYCKLAEKMNEMEKEIKELKAKTYIVADRPSWSDTIFPQAPDNVIPINEAVNRLKNHLGVMFTKVPEHTSPSHVKVEKVKK